MSLEVLSKQVQTDLEKLNYGAKSWVLPQVSVEGHVYDVVIVGGGQSGLGTAFGLKRERIDNILVIDECPEGLEGPWLTYARMMTLRTPKHLTAIDLGVPSLTFRSYWEAQVGTAGWENVEKIPRADWMAYLRWYRRVLDLPVQNRVKLTKIVPGEDGIYRLHVEGGDQPVLHARKVVLATGMQGGGEWHTPSMISENLSSSLYAHTSQPIDFDRLRGKKIGILGGGASAFDNANYALTEGVGEVHVFVRRPELPRINPIRQMEVSGLIEHYCSLGDADKYAAMAHFLRFNQPPTNDTFSRAASWPGFRVHTGSPWTSVTVADNRVCVTTPKGLHEFDFVIISTGLISDPRLRPELKEIVDDIALWQDVYTPPEKLRNPLLDAHPYLDGCFGFRAKQAERQARLRGLFVFNYSTLLSMGLSASALSGIRFAIPKLVAGIGSQLFVDDRAKLLGDYFSYDEEEFVADRQEQFAATVV
jgi:cation diffusion facilitator CzcD-associated flavoprotein CzcO